MIHVDIQTAEPGFRAAVGPPHHRRPFVKAPPEVPATKKVHVATTTPPAWAYVESAWLFV